MRSSPAAPRGRLLGLLRRSQGRRPSLAGRWSAAWERISPFIGGSKGPVLLLSACSAASGVAEAFVLALIAQIAVVMSAEGAVAEVAIGPFRGAYTVMTLFGLALTATVLRFLLQIGVAYLPSRLAADAQASIRSELFRSFVSGSWAVQAEDRDGHLQEVLTAHVAYATQAILALATGLAAVGMFLALVVSAIAISPPLAGLMAVAAFILFGILRPLARQGRRHAHSKSRASLTLAAGVSGAVRLAEESHVFGAGQAQSRAMDRLVDGVREPYYRMTLVSRVMPEVYRSLAIILVIGGLAVLYLTGAERLATLGAVVLILVRALAYGQKAQVSYQHMHELIPYIDTIRLELDRYTASRPVHGDRVLRHVDPLVLQDVTFAYEPGQLVLRGIDVTIPQGEIIGVVGPSGAGKSTLVQILLRLREPDAGLYELGGHPATEYRTDSWVERVAYVPQEPQLIDGTVADNIRFYRTGISQEQVERAARLANIHDEITAWEGGYERPIGQRVDAVSGGQRQRICLARALVAEPFLLVLDEPTSSLDSRSETLVGESIRMLKGDVTVILVTHRLSTLDICDRVLIVEQGRVEAFDELPTLLETAPHFRDRLRDGPVTKPEKWG
jgi:ATP-binding cassette, subfamily B, bacterial